jgi:hypothetical protein
VNFTIPSADLRRMIDRLKPCRGVGPWVGRFDLYGAPDLLVASTGETVSAEVSSRVETADDDAVTLPLAGIEAWLAGVDGTVTVEQDDTIVTFTTDDASLPVPLAAPEHEPALPPAPRETLPLPEAVWPALARVSWAARRMDANPPTAYNMLHVIPGSVWASDDKGFAMVAIPEVGKDVSFYPELADVLRFMSLEDTKVTVDEDRRLHLTDSHGRYVLPTFAGSVPSIGSLSRFTDALNRHVTFNRKELHDALGFLKALMAPDSNRVLASFEFGVCVLEVTTTNDQPATREVSCGSGAEGVNLGFNLATMRAALASLHGEKVTLDVADGQLPIVMREGDYTALLMPIKGGAPARARDRASARKPRF